MSPFHFKLGIVNRDFRDGSVINWPYYTLTSWADIIGSSFSAVSMSLHLLWTHSLQMQQMMTFDPTFLWHTAQGYFPDLSSTSRPTPDIMNFVLLILTRQPFFSIASFQALRRTIHFSRVSAMMSRSSARGHYTKVPRKGFQHQDKQQWAEHSAGGLQP